MTKITRIVVLATALMSLFAAATSTAGAVTWHNTGDTAFTGTGGAGTLSSTGVSLTCSSADGTGTTGPTPFVGATWTGATGTVTFTGCRLAGITTSVTCTGSLTGTTWIAGPPSVTSGSGDTTCNVTQGGIKICHIEGTAPGTYTNPSGGTNGKSTVLASTTLKTTNPASGTCPLGNGDSASITSATATITAATGGPGPLHQGPIITRTP